MSHLSELQIDSEALRHNVRQMRTLVPDGAQTIAVVKSNAYGHGLREVVAAVESEVDGFQVDDIEELHALRRLTSKRILVLGYVRRSSLREAIELEGELAIYDLLRLRDVEEIAKELELTPKVHLKIDTLLGRQGILPSEVDGFTEALRDCPSIDLEAVYTHFANIEDTTDLTHARAQVELFEDAFSRIKGMGWPRVGRHLSATSGIMVNECDTSGNSLVRVGIGMYGLYPSTPLARRQVSLELRPAARWVSHLAQVKSLPPGHPVGYGLTYVTWRDTLVGIVPQGYGDGYDRGFSSSGEVLVRGQRCPVIGRVAMNMFAIDLTHAPQACPEDEVVLLGSQEGTTISAEELAARLGTINYEVVTRISPLLPRTLLS